MPSMQESTSEAVNAYYGLYLLGKARGSTGLADWGRVLLATEIRSAQRYWHVRAAVQPQVYPQPFAANKVVGVLWNSLVRHWRVKHDNVHSDGHCIRPNDHPASNIGGIHPLLHSICIISTHLSRVIRVQLEACPPCRILTPLRPQMLTFHRL